MNTQIGRRYQLLEAVGHGGMGAVYLARDRLANRNVALKRLLAKRSDVGQVSSIVVDSRRTIGLDAIEELGDAATVLADRIPGSSQPAASSVAAEAMRGSEFGFPRRTQAVGPETLSEQGPAPDKWQRLMLANEFKILATLRHPHIISVLDYGFDETLHPFFTMEYLPDARTLAQASHSLPTTGKLEFLVQVLLALEYLHRRGVIHCDLKPANVLVADGQVRVLDFGISKVPNWDPHRRWSIAGTLPYMAPELFTLAPADERSDLYAVGVMAYELLAGFRPFRGTDARELRSAILNEAPDLSVMDPVLAPIIERLLAKDPMARHASAAEVLAAMEGLAGGSISSETDSTRESFLQAAELVGRDMEMAQLSAAIGRLSRRQLGAGILVAGESGVGKSRFVEELRVRALINGVHVLRGQTVREGRSSYHIWRDILRWLALDRLSDFELGVMMSIVADLGARLGRVVAPVPDLDPNSAQNRFLTVVENLFRRQGVPILLILEDLQWIGSDSLKLLDRISQLCAGQPLLVVATYRDDEAPDLPDFLPSMERLTLGRLSPSDVAALCQSMLGDAGRSPDLVEFVGTETEGNPFFLVEVVRALAEQAGSLRRVGSTPLPASVFAGGIHAIVKRRLDRVRESDRPLLSIAAVLGRQIDPALLRHIEPSIDLDRWIASCASVAVLDIDHRGWRFAHDKLREGLTREVPRDQKATFHRRAAEAIEHVYPDDSEYVARLAHHWRMAGVRDKGAHYCEAAGRIALKNSAYREAIEFFEQALATLAESSRDKGARSPVTERARRLWNRLRFTVGPEPRSPDEVRMATIARLIAETYFQLGELEELKKHGSRALALMGVRIPQTTPELLADTLHQIALRVLQTAWPAGFQAHSPAQETIAVEAGWLYVRLIELYIFELAALELASSGLRVINLGTLLGESPVLARGLAMMSVTVGVIPPLRSVAARWGRRAVEIAETGGQPEDLMFALNRSSAYFNYVAKWRELEVGARRAAALAEECGDTRQWGESMIQIAGVALFQGDFARAAKKWREVHDSAVPRGDMMLMTWGLMGHGEALMRLERLDEALEALEQAMPWVREHAQVSQQIWAFGVLALCHQYRGEYDRACEIADETLELIRNTQPLAYWIRQGLIAVAEVYAESWHQSNTGRRAEARVAHYRDALRTVSKAGLAFARAFPFGAASAWIWHGQCQHLDGDTARAQRSWTKALALARESSLPFEQALCHLRLGSTRARDARARERHLTSARTLLTPMGAARELARLEAVLIPG